MGNAVAAACADARPLGADADARRVGYEVKWDGFRCLVSTEDGFRARSRRAAIVWAVESGTSA